MEAAKSRPELGVAGIGLTRIPREEQDVVALFFDLLGLGILRAMRCTQPTFREHMTELGSLNSPMHLKIDTTLQPTAWVLPNKFQGGLVRSPSKCFVEFKFTTDGLVRDVRSGEKRLSDIKWLVCWEIGNRHINEGIGITDITEPAQQNQRDYYRVTHIMTEGQSKTYVICLQKLLEMALPAE